MPSKPAENPDQKSLAGRPSVVSASGGVPRKAGSSNPPASSMHDPISQLLTGTPASPRPAEATGKPATSEIVLAAQRALVKLGFVLKADGVAGPATRQAIERYERDRGLPVRGDLTPALARKLSAETGLPIN